jgi:hypothetical protein
MSKGKMTEDGRRKMEDVSKGAKEQRPDPTEKFRIQT